MGIEIKASSNVRWRIISKELLSLRHSIDIMAINQLLSRLRGVTCILTADPRARRALGSAVSIHVTPRSLGSN